MASPMYLDHTVLDSFRFDEFESRTPFRWTSIEHVLTPEAFATLLRDFPPLSLFAWHEGQPRIHGQRPQDRWYLAYESSPYPNYEGVVRRSDLAESWQAFIDELETDRAYRDLIARCLGRDDVKVRYAWHVGVSGSEVSPHVDDPRKAGTHIYYFNTADDWRDAWGGATLVLDDKHTPALNPDFSEFGAKTVVPTVGNRSFLFRNQPDAWHGVEALTCPEGSHRRLFNVIFEIPDAAQPRRRTLRQRFAGLRAGA
jgi:hypothetical protein